MDEGEVWMRRDEGGAVLSAKAGEAVVAGVGVRAQGVRASELRASGVEALTWQSLAFRRRSFSEVGGIGVLHQA